MCGETAFRGAFNLLGVQVNRVISAIVNALTNITIA
jgi:hypothetical protein